MGGALNPVGTMRNVGPGPHMRDACHQSVDITIESLEPFDVAVDPVVRQTLATLTEMLEKLAEQGCVLFRHRLAEVRHLTHFPQELDPSWRMEPRQELGHLRQG